MNSKTSLLLTLGALVLGTGLGMSAAEAAQSDQIKQECEYIKKLNDVDQLANIVRLSDSICATVALERIVELTKPAAGPAVVGAPLTVADVS
jgi:hypothetical protein